MTRSALPHNRAAPWLTFAPIVLLHTLFVVTFPLNNKGGDAANYLDMMVRGVSSLVHAGGYPFLMGLPLRHGPLAGLAPSAPHAFDVLLLGMQHAIVVLAAVALYVFVRRFFGTLTASLAALLFGTDLQFISATSSTYPEWLQASMLIFAGWAAAQGFFSPHGPRRVAWYAAAVSFFAWCFLIKFNAAVLAVLFLLPAAAERQPVGRKALWGVAFILVGLLNIWVYQAWFHYPSTGTRRLTADTGWVLLTRIQHVYGNTLPPSNGPVTKRWLALSSALPMRYDVAGPGLFSHVDAVSPEIRAPYRAVFDRLSTADEASLERWLADHPLPQGFSVGVSLIPVCFFVGLFEGNDLAVRVALEAIKAQPGPYARAVAADIRSAFATRQRYPLFPGPVNMPGFGFSRARQLPRGFVELAQPAALHQVPYGYRSPTVWWPGVRLFDWLDRHQVPMFVHSLLIALAVAAALAASIRQRRVSGEAAVVLALAAGVVALVLASCMTLEFRWKEFCLALPLVCVLTACGLTWAPRQLQRLGRPLSPA